MARSATRCGGTAARPLRGLLPLRHRSRKRLRPVDPLHDGRAAGRRGHVLAVVHGDGPARRRASSGASTPGRRTELTRDRRPLRAADRRRGPHRSRDDRRVRGRQLGRALGAARAGGRARAPVAAQGQGGQDDPRAAASGVRGRGNGRASTGERSSWTGARGGPGPPVGLQARRPLGVGALQRLRGARRLARVPTTGSTACRCSSRASGARSGRARRWSGASPGEDFASTSPLRVTRNDEPLRADDAGGWRRSTASARSSSTSTRRASGSSASPTTTPTGISPTATTARWPRCASACGSATAASRRAGAWSTSSSPRAARTSSTRSARRFPDLELQVT